jgi:predicted Abi (CAAX) family protease
MGNKKPYKKQRLSQKRQIRVLVVLLLSAIAISLFYSTSLSAVVKESNYAIHKRQDFNQSKFYPIKQTVNPNLYQPLIGYGWKSNTHRQKPKTW